MVASPSLVPPLGAVTAPFLPFMGDPFRKETWIEHAKRLAHSDPWVFPMASEGILLRESSSDRGPDFNNLSYTYIRIAAVEARINPSNPLTAIQTIQIFLENYGAFPQYNPAKNFSDIVRVYWFRNTDEQKAFFHDLVCIIKAAGSQFPPNWHQCVETCFNSERSYHRWVKLKLISASSAEINRLLPEIRRSLATRIQDPEVRYKCYMQLAKLPRAQNTEEAAVEDFRQAYGIIDRLNPNSSTFLRGELIKYLIQAKILSKGMKINRDIFVENLRQLQERAQRSDDAETRYEVLKRVAQIQVNFGIQLVQEDAIERGGFTSMTAQFLAKVAKEQAKVNPEQARRTLQQIEVRAAGSEDPVFVSLLDTCHALIEIVKEKQNQVEMLQNGLGRLQEGSVQQPQGELLQLTRNLLPLTRTGFSLQAEEDLLRAERKILQHMQGVTSRAVEGVSLLTEIVRLRSRLGLSMDLQQEAVPRLNSIQVSSQSHTYYFDLLSAIFKLQREFYILTDPRMAFIIEALKSKAEKNILYSLKLAELLTS